jgi:hypothetical protein
MTRHNIQAWLFISLNKKMKHLLFLIIFCFSITCASSQGNYGAGVTHSNVTPVAAPQYPVKPSLLWFDSLTQALWVNNKTFGWWLLMSPSEVYDRGIINMYFADNQDISYSAIEQKIRTQAGVGKILNGLYICKFTSATGRKTEFATLLDIPVLPVVTYVTDNDYEVFKYSRNKLISHEKFDDKANEYFSLIENNIKILKDSVRLLNDTAKVHRIEIDSLKRLKNPTTTVVNNLSCCDTLKQQITIINQRLDTLKPTDENLIYAISPVHAGRLGVPMNRKFKAAYKNIMGIEAGTIIERMY